LGGIVLNALMGWRWADPVAAPGVTYFVVRGGREGEECVDESAL